MTFIPDEKFDIKLVDDPNKVRFDSFGVASGIGTSDTPIDLWSGWDLDASLNSYNFTTTAGTWAISSTNAGDTQSVKILRLIDDYQIDSVTVVLTGQTKVTLSGNTLRVLEVKNNGTSDFAGDIYLYEDGATTAGVPDTLADVRSYIPAGPINISQQLITTVPAGFTLFLSQTLASVNKDTGATVQREAQLRLDIRPLGGVFLESAPFDVHNYAGLGNSIELAPWQAFPEKLDLKARIDSVSTNGSSVSGGIIYVLKSDSASDVAIIKNF